MTTTTIRNGVDAGRLVHTISAIEDYPAVASFTLRSTTTWQQGGASTTQISSFTHTGRQMPHARTHVLRGDKPDVLLGGDTGPNAVELVLAALRFCHSVGFAHNAAALGYELEALSFDIQGDLDLRNFVGIQHGPRPGFTAIRVHGNAKARNATTGQPASCPVTSSRPLRSQTSSPTRCQSRSHSRPGDFPLVTWEAAPRPPFRSRLRNYVSYLLRRGG